MSGLAYKAIIRDRSQQIINNGAVLCGTVPHSEERC